MGILIDLCYIVYISKCNFLYPWLPLVRTWVSRYRLTSCVSTWLSTTLLYCLRASLPMIIHISIQVLAQHPGNSCTLDTCDTASPHRLLICAEPDVQNSGRKNTVVVPNLRWYQSSTTWRSFSPSCLCFTNYRWCFYIIWGMYTTKWVERKTIR